MRKSWLLTTMLVFIGGTVGGALLKGPFGTPGMIVGSLVGSLFGWQAARSIMRQLF